MFGAHKQTLLDGSRVDFKGDYTATGEVFEAQLVRWHLGMDTGSVKMKIPMRTGPKVLEAHFK